MNVTKVYALYFSPAGTTRRLTVTLANALAESFGVPLETVDITLPAAREEARSMNPSHKKCFVLDRDGTVVFKTDNTGLFEWSVLEVAAADLRILDLTRDLHADPEAAADNIETEYEAKYSGLGETIKRAVIGRGEASAEEDE